jgi:predicted DCC family thiol-disulfide oxidoreductase YuxK
VIEGEGQAPVLLYDGACGLCSSTVRFVLRHDHDGSLRFATLQSPSAERVFAQHPELRGSDTVVWVDHARGQVLTRSAAVLRVAAYLKGVWRVALVFYLVPRRIRDWAYDLVARHRHLLMEGAGRCWVPPSNVQDRFLDST